MTCRPYTKTSIFWAEGVLVRPKGRSPIEAKGIFVTCHSIAPRHFGDAGLVLCGFGAPLSVAEVLTVYMFAHSVTQRGRRSGPTKQTLFGADEAKRFPASKPRQNTHKARTLQFYENPCYYASLKCMLCRRCPHSDLGFQVGLILRYSDSKKSAIFFNEKRFVAARHDTR